ncbi:hypothetical protein [Streptomyces sp. NPDC001315]|uniref:hypothetical protein n=1 Tax=Streptomyces sp. NPDC001315 TaxID=3364562 RepID=UPI0036C04209
MSSLIDAATGVMLELAMHPLTLDIDADGTRLLAMMDEYALLTRSRGPYSPNNLPPEALDTVDWVMLRWSLKSRPQRPEFTIEGGGAWPTLAVRFPSAQVFVRYVVPEAVPPELYVPDPGNVTLSGDLRMALKQLADSLRAAGRHLGGEPPVTLSLSYPDDPDHERHVASVHEDFRDAFPPVIATVDVDRSRCSREQRAAHDEALREVTSSDQLVERLGDTGFTTRLGFARLRDGGT